MAVTVGNSFYRLTGAADAIAGPLMVSGILIQSGATGGAVTLSTGGKVFYTVDAFPVSSSDEIVGARKFAQGVTVTALPATCSVVIFVE